jgi:hypothetical protein
MYGIKVGMPGEALPLQLSPELFLTIYPRHAPFPASQFEGKLSPLPPSIWAFPPADSWSFSHRIHTCLNLLQS